MECTCFIAKSVFFPKHQYCEWDSMGRQRWAASPRVPMTDVRQESLIRSALFRKELDTGQGLQITGAGKSQNADDLVTEACQACRADLWTACRVQYA